MNMEWWLQYGVSGSNMLNNCIGVEMEELRQEVSLLRQYSGSLEKENEARNTERLVLLNQIARLEGLLLQQKYEGGAPNQQYLAQLESIIANERKENLNLRSQIQSSISKIDHLSKVINGLEEKTDIAAKEALIYREQYEAVFQETLWYKEQYQLAFQEKHQLKLDSRITSESSQISTLKFQLESKSKEVEEFRNAITNSFKEKEETYNRQCLSLQNQLNAMKTKVIELTRTAQRQTSQHSNEYVELERQKNRMEQQYKAEIESKNKELEELRKSKFNLSIEKEEFANQQCLSLQHELNLARARINQLTASSQQKDLQKMSFQLERQKQLLESKYAADMEFKKRQMEEYRRTVTVTFRQKEEISNQRCLNLQNQLNILRGKISELTLNSQRSNGAAEVERQNQWLESQCARQKSKISQLQSNYQLLVTANESLAKRNRDLQTSTSTISFKTRTIAPKVVDNSALVDLQQKVAFYQAIHRELKSNLTEKEKEIAALEQALKNFKEHRAVMERALEEKSSHIYDLELNKFETQRGEKQELRREIERMRTEQEEGKREHVNLVSENASLKKRLMQLKEDASLSSRAKEELMNMAKEAESNTMRLHESRIEINFLRNTIAGLQFKNQELQGALIEKRYLEERAIDKGLREVVGKLKEELVELRKDNSANNSCKVCKRTEHQNASRSNNGHASRHFNEIITEESILSSQPIRNRYEEDPAHSNSMGAGGIVRCTSKQHAMKKQRWEDLQKKIAQLALENSKLKKSLAD